MQFIGYLATLHACSLASMAMHLPHICFCQSWHTCRPLVVDLHHVFKTQSVGDVLPYNGYFNSRLEVLNIASGELCMHGPTPRPEEVEEEASDDTVILIGAPIQVHTLARMLHVACTKFTHKAAINMHVASYPLTIPFWL